MGQVLSKAEKIRQLNDHLRIHFGGGKVMLSASVQELSHDLKAAALMQLREFSDFNENNDPHGEHDFGDFQIGHYHFVWCIDYYDKECIGGSEDPSDFDKTTRVLTFMLREDY